jgi:hypothetical protein
VVTASPTALHEAAHCVVAVAVGREALSATVSGGQVLDGCCRYTTPEPIPLHALDVEAPFVLWPQAVRRRLETDALISLAGDIAEELLSEPVAGRVADPAAVVAAEMAASPADHAWAAVTVDSLDSRPDSWCTARAVFAAVGRDAIAVAAWTAWLDCQARQLVIWREPVIRAVAAALDAHGTLGAEALAALIP